MTTKKNICLTINSLAPGGAEKQCLLLAKALKPYHNVIVAIIIPQPIYQPHVAVLEKEGLDHIFLSKNPVKRIFEFTRILKKRKIDMIFSYLPTDTVWAAICGKAARVQYIFGGIRSSHLPWFKYTALRLIHNYSLSYTIANNYAAQTSAIEFGFKEKVFVIHNGIAIRPISEKREKEKNVITIISVGRLVKSKAYETAIKSMVELREMINKVYKIRLRIVGEGPEQENIIATIDEYNAQDEVELITDTSDIYSLLESSDIYLSASILEGISNALMEAMNCALPIVATDAGDNSRLILHGETGFITAFHDYKDMARHLSYLIESPEKREQIGLKGYDHLAQNFGYHAFQNKYLNIIENIRTIHVHEGELILDKESTPQTK